MSLTSAQEKAAVVWPGAKWTLARPVDVNMDDEQLKMARDYALKGGGSGYITRYGKLVMSWGDLKKRYDLKSTTKSIGVTALGLAIDDGKMTLSDKASQHHAQLGLPPESNKPSGWINDITVQHLATHTAGFEKPGGYRKLIFEPGTKWCYSDGGPNWLAECVTLAYQRDVNELMFERVFTPIGISRRDLTWRSNAYREKEIRGVARREFGSGISANVDAMARIGYLYLRRGKWKSQQLLSAEFIDKAGAAIKSLNGLPEVDAKRFGNASDHYGLLWWNNADGSLIDVPTDAYWSWGLYDSLIVVIPSLDIVVARAGRGWRRQPDWSGHYDVLKPFIGRIAKSTTREPDCEGGIAPSSNDDPPYPKSTVISRIEWEPAANVIRRAKGGDNWPITWGDDDLLYTAYGDGRGFKPYVERKLSMGLCSVSGGPFDFRGQNLRSPAAERTGDGKSGPKVSGLLMVDGVLYMLVRNTKNSQLAWSKDRGKTWIWSDWKFKTSFGYPTFLNYGKNYQGARDDYVYIYSPDSASAYKRADHMVLARVHRSQIKDRRSYQFLGRVVGGAPQWTNDIEKRGVAFKHEGRCYRSSVSYNSALKRYLWVQTGAGKDGRLRFEGGLEIYDAPEPWGPWTTAYYTTKWDIGPGETSCFPTKWMSKDGLTMYHVSSSNDSFSVRKATVILR